MQFYYLDANLAQKIILTKKLSIFLFFFNETY